MEKITFSEKKIINGETVFIERAEILKYNGEWIFKGYRAVSEKETHLFYSWPTDETLREYFFEKSH